MATKYKRYATKYGRAFSGAICDDCHGSYKSDVVRPYTVYGWRGSIFGTDVLLCEECAVKHGLKKPKPKGFRAKGKPKPDDCRAGGAGRPYGLGTPSSRLPKKFRRRG